jgi:hypothetical protein
MFTEASPSVETRVELRRGCSRQIPGTETPREETGPLGRKWLCRGHQEKPSSESSGCPYPKPTQVETEGLRRRVSEPSLRNSAT